MQVYCSSCPKPQDTHKTNCHFLEYAIQYELQDHFHDDKLSQMMLEEPTPVSPALENENDYLYSWIMSTYITEVTTSPLVLPTGSTETEAQKYVQFFTSSKFQHESIKFSRKRPKEKKRNKKPQQSSAIQKISMDESIPVAGKYSNHWFSKIKQAFHVILTLDGRMDLMPLVESAKKSSLSVQMGKYQLSPYSAENKESSQSSHRSEFQRNALATIKTQTRTRIEPMQIEQQTIEIRSKEKWSNLFRLEGLKEWTKPPINSSLGLIRCFPPELERTLSIEPKMISSEFCELPFYQKSTTPLSKISTLSGGIEDTGNSLAHVMTPFPLPDNDDRNSIFHCRTLALTQKKILRGKANTIKASTKVLLELPSTASMQNIIKKFWKKCQKCETSEIYLLTIQQASVSGPQLISLPHWKENDRGYSKKLHFEYPVVPINCSRLYFQIPNFFSSNAKVQSTYAQLNDISTPFRNVPNNRSTTTTHMQHQRHRKEQVEKLPPVHELVDLFIQKQDPIHSESNNSPPSRITEIVRYLQKLGQRTIWELKSFSKVLPSRNCEIEFFSQEFLLSQIKSQQWVRRKY